jgi:hypothetical protein
MKPFFGNLSAKRRLVIHEPEHVAVKYYKIKRAPVTDG